MSSHSRYTLFPLSDSPKITCYDTGAYVGDKNVYLRCDIRSKPRAEAVFWIIDRNGTTLSNGEVIIEYWSLNRVSFYTD